MNVTNYLPHAIGLSPPLSHNVKFCSDRGYVSVDFDTGKVEISPGLDLDEASMLFWERVRDLFPGPMSQRPVDDDAV